MRAHACIDRFIAGGDHRGRQNRSANQRRQFRQKTGLGERR
jgi:hypothetical protein